MTLEFMCGLRDRKHQEDTGLPTGDGGLNRSGIAVEGSLSPGIRWKARRWCQAGRRRTGLR